MSGLSTLNKLSAGLPEQEKKMPVLFVGHGSPMNAIEDNEYSRGWKTAAAGIPTPKAILCISAHWETRGTFVTAMETPKTIHDFYGFPPELYKANYPAKGDPSLAADAVKLVKSTTVGLDREWGFDHGNWSVLLNMYPKADIPVIQLSLDYTKPPKYHYDLAKELAALRKKGVLVVGSGNMVHNLGLVDFRNPGKTYDWAATANEKLKSLISSGDHNSLAAYTTLGKEVQLAVPTPEHYLPLLYILGLKDKNDKLSYFNDKTSLGSISMTSFRLG